MNTATEVNAASPGMGWLDAMPAKHCPEGCVVRRGDLLGVVTRNRGGYWTVAYLGRDPHFSAMGEEGSPRGGPPESDGWRHALDHRSGFSYVLTDYLQSTPSAQRDSIPNWGAIQYRHTFGKTTDTDRLQLARAYSGVS